MPCQGSQLEPSKLKRIAYPEMAKKSFLLMQISYPWPYIVWNNFPKFQENSASSFLDMGQSICEIVVGPDRKKYSLLKDKSFREDSSIHYLRSKIFEYVL